MLYWSTGLAQKAMLQMCPYPAETAECKATYLKQNITQTEREKTIDVPLSAGMWALSGADEWAHMKADVVGWFWRLLLCFVFIFRKYFHSSLGSLRRDLFHIGGIAHISPFQYYRPPL